MKSKTVLSAFIVSLVLAPAGFAVELILSGPEPGGLAARSLFGVTVAIEICALAQAIAARRLFSRSDRAHLTWTLIIAFLIVRLSGEVRLTTLTYGLVPAFREDSPAWLFFYVIVLRYLYTAGDLLFIASMVTTVRAYKSVGLKFELMARDYVYLLLVWAMPVTTFYYRANLGLGGIITADRYVVTYRLIAVFVGAVIASLCVMVRRYALQMGGGAVARVWNTVVIAGIARDASFLVLALLLRWWRPGAQFAEQYLLWIFSFCWLLAALYQKEVFTQLKSPGGAAAAV